MQLSAVVCHFTVHERFLIFQNFTLWDLPISIAVHFLDEVKSLLTTAEQNKDIRNSEYGYNIMEGNMILSGHS